MKNRLAVFLVIFLLSYELFSCSMITFPPTKISAGELAFAGSITGYVTAKTKILGLAGVPGLKVNINEYLLCPMVIMEAEVYLFGVNTDCTPRAWEIDDLKREYSIGSAVTIIGSPLGAISSYLNTPLVLFCHAGSFGFVARIPEKIPRQTDGLLDFLELKKQYKQNTDKEFSMEIAWRNFHLNGYEDYEYLRSLIKLQEAKSNEGRQRILENIAAYSGLMNLNLYLADIWYGHLGKSAHLDRASKKRLEQQFKEIHKTYSEY